MKTLHRKNIHKIATRDWFNQWSNQYDKTLGSIGFHRELLKLVVRNSGVKNSDKVLDIGCGTGLLSLGLLQRAGCFVTGIDISKEMLSIFNQKIKKCGLEKRAVPALKDIDSMNFKDNSFDIAVSSVVLHHLKNKLPAIKKVYKLLKPGGIFIIGEIDMDSTGKHTDVKRLKGMVRVLEEEWVSALKDAGIEAFARMYNNGIKHILNQGEYCISLKQWARLCEKAGFSRAAIKKVKKYKCFGIIAARKPV